MREGTSIIYLFLNVPVLMLRFKQLPCSLKAEHGTGRNVAPYVEMEWGGDGYKLMKQIKKLFDPQNLLNPGTLVLHFYQSGWH